MFDEAFGQLKHKFNFYKYENVNIFGKDCNVKIVVENDESNTVLDVQRSNYRNYKIYINDNQEKIIDLIKEYFFDVYGKKIDLEKDIRPISIYFSRDGSWGILFDTKIDEENGLAVFIKNSKLNIGTQDMLI